MGRAAQIFSAVFGFSVVNETSTGPVVLVEILICLSKLIEPLLDNSRNKQDYYASLVNGALAVLYWRIPGLDGYVAQKSAVNH